MSRTQRLLDLVQILRSHRYAVPGTALARELGVSLRTLYRDIVTLQAQGAPIEGEAGVGYVLRPGFLLPPLMFSSEELEALTLGLSWVARRTDGPLARAAWQAASKIKSVLPSALRDEMESTTLIAGSSTPVVPVPDDLGAILRRAIREERKLQIVYRDEQGRETERTVWPFGLGYFESVQISMAWCELRQGLRHFRADRMVRWTLLPQRYPESRTSLLARWRQSEGVPPDPLEEGRPLSPPKTH